MGCSSYVAVPDPADASATLYLQFKYGFLREISYNIGDEIQWEDSEIPEGIEIRGDAVVPAWTQDLEAMRHFALKIVANRISGLSEISEAEGDRMYDNEIEVFDGRHAWLKH